MKKIVFLLMLITSVMAVPQTVQQTPKATKQVGIEGLVSDWLTAEKQNDLTTLDKLIAEDFVGTTFAGTLIAKSDLVSEERGANMWAGASIQEVEVHSFGDTAAAVGRIVFKDSSLRFTEVWTKRPGGWQMVVAHLSKA